MDSNSAPGKILIPFANTGGKNTIPVTPNPTPGGASYTDGFPPLTRTPIAAGGIPPSGQDMNGVLFDATAVARWVCLGGLFEFDAAMSAQIGGYPKGSHLLSADETVIWLNTVENNTANPDTVGTGWVPAVAPGTFAQAGLTGGTVTLALSDAAKSRITCAGALISNSTLVVPNWVKDWTIVNNTTGAFTLTVKTASGTGIAIPQNGAPTLVNGDGTNIVQIAPNVAVGTAAAQAMRRDAKPLTLLQAYTVAGTNNPVVPAGVFGVHYKIWGGGGGGGGGSTGAQSGNGAGAGAYSEGWMAVTPGQTLTAVIGANGVGGANTGLSGTNGGASSLSNGVITVSCPGGGAGSGGGTGGGVGGVATGGDFNATGGNGSGPALVNAAGSLFYGPPGGGAFGTGNSAVGYGTGAGFIGRSPGGGGAGGAGGSAGAFAGGNGGVGAIYIWG